MDDTALKMVDCRVAWNGRENTVGAVKWNQLGDLYQWFTDTYTHLSLAELKGKLNENIAAIQTMIDSMSEEELFQPHMRR